MSNDFIQDVWFADEGDSYVALGYTNKRKAFLAIRKYQREEELRGPGDLIAEKDLVKTKAYECPNCGWYWWGDVDGRCDGTDCVEDGGSKLSDVPIPAFTVSV